MTLGATSGKSGDGLGGGSRGVGHFCLVVTELLGHRAAGGIATATTFLAELLAAAGHAVTLLDASPPEEELSAAWRTRYRANGIAVERLGRSTPVAPPYVADSYRAYHQLKGRDFDVIVFQDWRGLGYCSMSAKRSGLAFENSRLVHIVHGPTPWLWEANQTIELDTEYFAGAHLEQRAAEMADTVVGPSRYLIDWMAARWRLPADQRQIFYPTARMVGLRVAPELSTPAGGDPLGPLGAPRPAAPLKELVFFGRYEERKGIRIFAQALNRLGSARLAGLTVSFLGRAVPFSEAEVTALLDDDVIAAIDGPHFITNRDSLGARSYLGEPGRLALIPSLIDNSPNVVIECIEDEISFLAAASGGIPELVARADRDRVLFEPTVAALVARLTEVLDAGVVPAPAAQGWVDEDILPAWEALLEAAPPVIYSEDQPLVSVVIPHHAQLELFAHTLVSVVAQDYPNLEIVVVDDGTPDPAMVKQLAELLEEPWGRAICLIRQDNNYLGAARNTGVAGAKGDWLVFVDDDDVVEPNYVSTLVTAAQATGAAAVSSVLVTHLDDGSDLVGSHGVPYVFLGDAVHLAASWNTIGGAGCLVRREAWQAAGGFHTRHGVGHEDWTLLTAIALSGRTVVSVPEPLYRYRIRATSMLRSTSRYRNMRPVLDAFAPHLAQQFATWPELLHGQQQMIDGFRHRNAELESEVAALEQALRRALRQSADADGLRAERDALYASGTWKVGSVALSPWRAWHGLRRGPSSS